MMSGEDIKMARKEKSVLAACAFTQEVNFNLLKVC